MLDDMDFDRYGKVKCSKREGILPKLMKVVEGRAEKYEMNSMGKPVRTGLLGMVAMISQHTKMGRNLCRERQGMGT